MEGVLGLVSFRVFPTHMGGQKGVALFYEYLQHHIPAVLASSNDNQEHKGINQERILFPNKKIYRNIFKLSALKTLALASGSQYIIAEHSYTGWLAWLLRTKTGLPFIIHSHNIESRRFRQMNHWWWPLYHWYEGWIHRRADLNFFISEEDRQLAINEFRLASNACAVVTYGIKKPLLHPNKKELRKALGLDEHKKIFLFNGTLDYQPNFDAVVIMAEKLVPLLRQKLGNFEIIITGNRARKPLIEKIMGSSNINYLGYVADVNLYYQAADLFLNPVANDSGVKTKLIEAIANNCTAISTYSGASGTAVDVCGEKLVRVADDNWNEFADKVVEQSQAMQTQTPEAFYAYYEWEQVTAFAAKKIRELKK
jgi:polysaccharide biosynthesis protein PslH